MQGSKELSRESIKKIEAYAKNCALYLSSISLWERVITTLSRIKSLSPSREDSPMITQIGMMQLGQVFMVKKKKTDLAGLSQMAPYPRNNNLTRRNQALLYALGGFAVLLYFISFVRMGQW